jgi:hypothetical protein
MLRSGESEQCCKCSVHCIMPMHHIAAEFLRIASNYPPPQVLSCEACLISCHEVGNLLATCFSSKQMICCLWPSSNLLQLQADTCGDADGAGGSSDAYPCTGSYRPKQNFNTIVIQGMNNDARLAACCELVSLRATVMIRQGPEVPRKPDCGHALAFCFRSVFRGFCSKNLSLVCRWRF